jgi:hypothetical protein
LNLNKVNQLETELKTMTKGFAPRLKLAVKSQAKREDKRELTPLRAIQANLLNYVAELPDPRVQRTQKHLLKDILVISILAVIGGAEGWEDMENYGITKQQWLEEFLELPNGI